ncbi:glycosyltransferase family 4 protein [Methylobacterium nigriterrae]|uniref:glycosyltransferase family 4 protein n=1 Tax=Methylobacterium nigriterrae TaxID=3127512 RepID=UPI00301356DD
MIANAHPDHSVGGAEIAAYNLFRFLAEDPGVEAAVFLARTSLASVPPGSIVARRTGEFLWRQDIGDWFKLMTAYPRAVSDHFRAFLARQKPSVIFVHHYSHIGIEFLREIKRAVPGCKIVMTLHEYGAICNRQGQMLKNISNRLCYRESPEDCHLCFSDRSPEDFWLRKRYIFKHFDAVDEFVSPSEFLRRRYVEWGVPSTRIHVIENGQPSREADVARQGRASTRAISTGARKKLGRPIIVGYFGQINRYKGLDVLLTAIDALSDVTKRNLKVEVHGANLEEQPDDFRGRISKMRDRAAEEGAIHWVGSYERTELMRRMTRVDCVVVPSIWWENSPMVIQEAFVCGKPVICSGIGGMAEKVRDGVDGLHFEAGNPFSLAEKLTLIAADPNVLARLSANIQTPASYEECGQAYMRLAQQALDRQIRETDPASLP